ncbi:MAG: pilus assembly protein N-terminal domain-containing protein [Candidatus Baltobacteraceae bacterium]
MDRLEQFVIIQRTRAFLTVAALLLGLFGTGALARADAVSLVALQTGHSLILNADGLQRVAVGDGRIAGVIPVGTSQLIVNGKSPGHTTIFIWTNAGRTTYEVTVTEQSFDDIAKLLRSAIAQPDVQVVAFNVNLIVRGTVPDIAAYNRLNETIDHFKGVKFNGGQNGVIINAVTVAKPLGTLQDDIARIPGGKGLRVDIDPKGNVIVSGTVPDREQAEEVLARVRGLAGPYLATDGQVVDRIATDSTSQIDVKVYVLEIDKTALRSLGIAWGSAQWNGGPVNENSSYSFSSNLSLGAVEDPTKVNLYNLGPFARVSMLAPTLNLLMQSGHGRLLSAPDLVTLPGKEATFLVGGQIPIPQSNGLGTISITYKDYGVKLDVTPTLLGNGTIETKINPEVSNLDSADGVTLNGFVVPAFKTSRLSTDVITKAGESVVMGGLLSRVDQTTIQKVPLLGDIPILGQLFRSTQYQHSESDVVFVMTPTLVTK